MYKDNPIGLLYIPNPIGALYQSNPRGMYLDLEKQPLIKESPPQRRDAEKRASRPSSIRW